MYNINALCCQTNTINYTCYTARCIKACVRASFLFCNDVNIYYILSPRESSIDGRLTRKPLLRCMSILRLNILIRIAPEDIGNKYILCALICLPSVIYAYSLSEFASKLFSFVMYIHFTK